MYKKKKINNLVELKPQQNVSLKLEQKYRAELEPGTQVSKSKTKNIWLIVILTNDKQLPIHNSRGNNNNNIKRSKSFAVK